MNFRTYDQMTAEQRREVRMYGCTVDQMREAVEESLTFRFTGPAMYAASLLSDAQEMIAHDQGGTYSFMQVEDARQMINRAKWVLFSYAMEHRVMTPAPTEQMTDAQQRPETSKDNDMNRDQTLELALEVIDNFLNKTGGQAIYFMESERRVAKRASEGLRNILAHQQE